LRGFAVGFAFRPTLAGFAGFGFVAFAFAGFGFGFPAHIAHQDGVPGVG
jgi:hypothetical protein